MEWLKDKKNLPIVAGLGVVVLLLALVAILFETGVIGGQSAPVADGTSPPPGQIPGAASSNGAPPGVPVPTVGAAGGPAVASAVAPGPGAPAVPGAATPGAPAGAPAVPAAVNVAKGPDPFNVPRPKIATVAKRPVVDARTVAPFLSIVRVTPRSLVPFQGQTPLPQIRIRPEESATMRVSGVVQAANGVHAVLEANGQSQEVQPGDTVTGGTIVSIQADGLTLRTADSRNVRVPLGAGTVGVQAGGYPTGGYPGPGGFPGGGGYRPPTMNGPGGEGAVGD